MFVEEEHGVNEVHMVVASKLYSRQVVRVHRHLALVECVQEDG